MGFAVNISLFGLLYIAVSAFSGKLTILFYLYIIATLILLVLSLVYFLRKGEYKIYHSLGLADCFRRPLFFGFLGLVILVIVISTLNGQLEQIAYTGDYYIRDINNTLFTDTVKRGATYFGWNGYLSTFCIILGSSPEIIIPRLLPILFTPMCFFAYFFLSSRLFSQSRFRQLLFTYLMVFINIFGGNDNKIHSSLLMLDSWQGQTLMACFVFPILITLSIDIYRQKSTSVTWFFVSVALLLGSFLCATGKYLSPAFFVICMIPLFISRISKKEFSSFFILLRNLLFSVIPSILLMVDSFFMPALSGADKEFYSNISIPDWGEVFTSTLVFSAYFVIFILAYLFYMFYEKDNALRLLFVGMIPLIFITLLNPILIPFTTRYITGTIAYSQVCLMLPMYPMIAYLFTTYSFIFARVKLNIFLGTIWFITIALCGRFIYEPGLYFVI